MLLTRLQSDDDADLECKMNKVNFEYLIDVSFHETRPLQVTHSRRNMTRRSNQTIKPTPITILNN